ncbi:CMD domain protein [Paraburkholderia xenovorans]|uniref:CMD domain protein n=1 Tax=Paraburkholderia xenovorans TaxID=36873 RepID=UPI0038B9C715
MSSSPPSPSAGVAGTANDLVAQLAGLAPDSPVAALREFRGDTTRYTQGSHDALFSDDVVDLTLRERLYAAWYAALLSNADQAAQAYRERLLALPTDNRDATSSLLDAITEQRALPTESFAALDNRVKRLAAILIHTEAVVQHPSTVGKPALESLQAAGLTTRAIVALSQLIAFVTFQVRIVAALRALEANA